MYRGQHAIRKVPLYIHGTRNNLAHKCCFKGQHNAEGCLKVHYGEK